MLLTNNMRYYIVWDTLCTSRSTCLYTLYACMMSLRNQIACSTVRRVLNIHIHVGQSLPHKREREGMLCCNSELQHSSPSLSLSLSLSCVHDVLTTPVTECLLQGLGLGQRPGLGCVCGGGGGGVLGPA